jgi:hypothetical protein
MSQAVRTTANRPPSPEVVRTIANTAATVEIAIRRAANSGGGRALASVVRDYPLWSVFIASSLGFLLRGGRRSGRRHAPPPPPRPASAPVAKRRF